MALHTIAFIVADRDRYHSAKEIAENLSVSEAHLAKVLQRLARSGILRSVRGPKGGFRLDRPSERISLLNVLEVVDGPLITDDCLMAERTCRGAGCVFSGLLPMINGKFRDYLERTRLIDLKEIYAAP